MTRRLRLFVGGSVAAVVAATACVPPHDMTAMPPAPRGCDTAGIPAAVAGADTVRWFVPAQRSDNEVLETWCVHVGPPAWSPQPERPGAPLEAADTLLVVSWNTNGGSGDVVDFLDRTIGHRCADPAAPSPAFVLLLQEALRRSARIPDTPSDDGVALALSEIPRATERLSVDEIAARCGLSLLYVPSARNGAEPRDGLREDRGNAILSTLPLSDPWAIELPFEGSRRVAVSASVPGPYGRRLRVGSVHFHTVPKPWRLLTTANGSRVREALALVDATRRLDGEVTPVAPPTVLGGDFNTWSSSATALRRIRDHFVDSPDPLEEPTRGPFPTDHLFFRRGDGTTGGIDLVPGSYLRLDDEFNSDHYPIRALLVYRSYPIENEIP